MTETIQMFTVFGFGLIILTIFLIALLFITRRPKQHHTYCCMSTCYYWENNEHIADGTCKTNPMIDSSQRCVSYMNARCARSNTNLPEWTNMIGDPTDIDPVNHYKNAHKKPTSAQWFSRRNKKVH